MIKGIEDKWDITVFLAVTLSGVFLPPQLLYESKTDRYHPNGNFPHVFHTDDHWSNTSTVLRFIDKVLNPYLQGKREELGLPEHQKALLILDMFRAHCTAEVQQKLSQSNIMVVFVPANCKDMLQPLNITVHKPLKKEMRKKFVEWYSSCVAKKLKSGKSINDINLGLIMSVVKPLSANWFIICNGFRAAGISTF